MGFVNQSEFRSQNNKALTEQYNFQKMMSSQAVPDRVNKYRYGVLIGNFAEEAFGLDHASKDIVEKPVPQTTMKATHRLQNSLHNFHPVITPEPNHTQTFYQFAPSVNRDGFIQPESESTYNIFYRKQVHRRVPVVQNNCKREERLHDRNQLYEFTKTKLDDQNLKWPHSSNSVKVDDPSGAAGGQGVPDQKDAYLNLGMALTGAIDAHVAGGGKPGEGAPGEGDDNARVANILGSTGRIPPVRAKSLNPFSTNTLIRPEVRKIDDLDYAKLVLPHEEGQQRDILFGHGLEVDHFHKREFATTYDLSFNQQIKPQTQIMPQFTPDLTKTAKEFHKQWHFEKNHQPRIPQYSDRKELYNDKICRPYAPYTKTFDQNHMKTQYLRK